jgi:N-methylhydantoinase B
MTTPRLDDEIIRNALLVAAEEAAITVVRAAHSQFIVEGSDAGAAILTMDGELIAQAAATSMLHSGGIAESVRAIVRDFPPEDMSDGDVFVINDPYRGGVHANDVTVARPVFVDRRPAFMTAALIHVLDLGGSAHGGVNAHATETLEEGIQIPPLHYENGGSRNEELVKLLRLNSRAPDETLGDIDALAAGTLISSRRLQALVVQHGPAHINDAVTSYLDQTERRTREEISRLPDGTWSAQVPIDDDGIHHDKSYVVAVDVTIRANEMSLDFSRTSDQVRASINSSASQAFDAAVFAVRCFLDKDIPANSGVYRAIQATFRRGSLLDPEPPHPCGGRMVAVYAVVDAIVRALSEAVPTKRSAPSGILIGYSIAGTENPYWIHNSFDFGGVGARNGSDGVDAVGFHFGVGRNQIPQVEPVEERCHVRCEAVQLITDSGGAGQWRGGLGVRVIYQILADAVLSHRTDHFATPPEGLQGGHMGRRATVAVISPDGRRTDLPSKIANAPVGAGWRIIIETSGGGGVGRPEDRPTEAISRDVREGKVSLDVAREIYAVVLQPDGTIDESATAKLRAQVRRR